MLQVEPGRRRVIISGTVVDGFTQKPIAGALVRIVEAPATFARRLVIPARQVWLGVAPVLADPQAALDQARIVLKNPVAKLQDRVIAARSVFANPLATSADELRAAQAVLDYQDSRQASPAKRADQTSTAADGSFYFATSRQKDLLDGDYLLRAWLPGAGSRYGDDRQPATVLTAEPVPEPVPVAKIRLILPPTGLTGRIVDAASPLAPKAGIDMAEVRVEGSGEFTFSGSALDPQRSGAFELIGLEKGPRSIRVTAQGFDSQTATFDLVHGEVAKDKEIALAKA